MADVRWKMLTEEDKYTIWSAYYENTSTPLSYSEWCDLMDGCF